MIKVNTCFTEQGACYAILNVVALQGD